MSKALRNSLTQSECLGQVLAVSEMTVLGFWWGVARCWGNPGGEFAPDRRVGKGFLGKVTSELRHAESMGLAEPEWKRWGRGSHFRQREQRVQSSQAAEPKAQKGQEVVW